MLCNLVMAQSITNVKAVINKQGIFAPTKMSSDPFKINKVLMMMIATPVQHRRLKQDANDFYKNAFQWKVNIDKLSFCIRLPEMRHCLMPICC